MLSTIDRPDAVRAGGADAVVRRRTVINRIGT
jgi:hypothetical protein